MWCYDDVKMTVFQYIVLSNNVTVPCTRKPRMSLLMAALAVFVLYTNLYRCSRKYVLFNFFV